MEKNIKYFVALLSTIFLFCVRILLIIKEVNRNDLLHRESCIKIIFYNVYPWFY